MISFTQFAKEAGGTRRIRTVPSNRGEGGRLPGGRFASEDWVLDLPPDGNTGNDRDNNRNRAGEERLKVVDETEETYQHALTDMAANGLLHARSAATAMFRKVIAQARSLIRQGKEIEPTALALLSDNRGYQLQCMILGIGPINPLTILAEVVRSPRLRGSG